MKAAREKISQALLLLKAAADDIEKTSSTMCPAYHEAATAFACASRARRLLLEAESAEVPA